LESLKKIRELKKNVITGHEGIVYKEELLWKFSSYTNLYIIKILKR
jgi:hypothetical protein